MPICGKVSAKFLGGGGDLPNAPSPPTRGNPELYEYINACISNNIKKRNRNKTNLVGTDKQLLSKVRRFSCQSLATFVL